MIHGTYVGNGRVLASAQYGARLFYPADDIHVMPLLVSRGYHEPSLTNWFAQSLERGMRVVDVGAHVGYFTVLMSRCVGPTGYVAAFEPMPKIAELLRTNLSANYVTPMQGHTVEVFEQAVSAKKGRQTLHWSEGEESGASLSGQHGTLGLNPQTLDVECTTLDVALPEGRYNVIKIDAEGLEYQVIKGAKKVLSQTGVLIFEWNIDVLGNDAEPLYDWLEQIIKSGATLHYLATDGGVGPRDLRDLKRIPFEAHVMLNMRGVKP